jgi:3,4-dihydroxy 2-butanone 4-phosphate synthase/GTP cyclohydrolase II
MRPDWPVSVTQAVSAIGEGRAVLIVDEAARECSLVTAAETVTSELLDRLMAAGTGTAWVAIPKERLRELELPAVPEPGQTAPGLPPQIGIGHRDQTDGGASLADRVRTIAALADWTSSAAEFVKRGYVFPVASEDAGVLSRPGRPEAAIDLASLACCTPAAVICDLPDAALPPGRSSAEALHAGVVVTVEAILAARRRRGSLPRKLVTAALPSGHGQFEAVGFRDADDGREHLALVMGDVRGGPPSLVRVHRECSPGDIFGAIDCGCADRLGRNLAAIAEDGRGALAYVRRESTYDKLAHSPRRDDLDVGAQILAALGITDAQPLSDDPDELESLRRAGLTLVEWSAEQRPIPAAAEK